MDVIREPEQSLEEYQREYLAMIEQDWNTLTAPEKREAAADVLRYHRPETVIDLQGMGAEAGLREFRVVWRQRQHALMAFYF
jgi:hypothetical protein